MLVLDDILLGLLAGAIITLADRRDGKVAEADREALEQLKAHAQRLSSPEERCRRMVDEALRDEYALDGVAPKIADATAGDPVLASELVAWLLEADPDRHIEGRGNLGEKLATMTGAERDDVDAFLHKLADRMYGHFDLMQLRQDGKLNVIFRQLQELTGLDEKIHSAFCDQAATLRGIIEEHSISVLHPVKPNPRPASKDNTMLSGGRPSDRDIDEDIDFRRTQFQAMMKAIFETEKLPASFVFLAEIQRGKTTFLKRVGWELARSGYPVLQLSTGAHSEPYAEWAVKHAAKETEKPLVLLIDDPLQNREHFEGQMNVFHEKSASVIVLIASRPEDWEQLDKDKAPLVRRATEFDLNPDKYESEKVVAKLRHRGLIVIDDEQLEPLLEEIDAIPFSKGYFGEVIRIASRDEYRPMPMLIAEHLERCDDPETVEAFRKAYRYICVPGIVGMSLPESVYRLLVPEPTREAVRRFIAVMPMPPIREEDGEFSVTHEAHAEAGLVEADIGALLREMIETLVEEPQSSTFWGNFLESLRQRGAGQIAIDTWAVVADRVTDEHWNACDSQVLSTVWGSIFYHEDHFDLAVHVIGIAVYRDPDSSMTHNNYAILLKTLERDDEALEHYEIALGINSDNSLAHNNYALLLKDMGRDEEALEHLESAMKINPDYADAHNNYANLLKKRGRDDEALDHFETALEINPEYASAHFNYANLLKKLGRDDEALEHYETALRINPELANTHNNYALLLQKRGRDDEALEHYETALRINPELVNAHNNYALLLEKLERDDEALEHYETALRIDPEHAEGHANITKQLLSRDDIERSLDHTVQALRLRSLPDRGLQIPSWFEDHVDTLEEIMEDDEQDPERRGVALAILIVNKSEQGLQLMNDWDGKPEFADSLAVCKEILEIWEEAAREKESEGD